MLRIKGLFQDVNGLHRRVDTLLHNSSVGRLVIVPENRLQGRPLLECLVADPIGDDRWAQPLADRPLTKDILVTQSDSFEFIRTQNSLTEFPVPFKGPPLEILEVDAHNRDHLETADLVVTLGDVDVPGFPVVRVFDDEFRTPKVTEHSAIISTAKASRADSLLRASPKNISQWLELHSQSGVDALKERLFRPVGELRRDLGRSVTTTLAQIITKSLEEQTSSSATQHKVQQLRQTWSKEAHREMQLMLNKFDSVLARQLAWYALYYRIDDVETVLRDVPVLPQSRISYEYVTGSIDSLVHAPSTKTRPALDVLEANIATRATALHNSALKQLSLQVLGVQLPISGVAAAGVYFEQFSGYSMAALAAFGVAIGFNRLQKSWLKSCAWFVQHLEKDTKTAISESETQLWNIYEQKRANQAEHIREQQDVLEMFEKELGGERP